MNEFVECVECGFVTLASGSGADPAGWESCPDCGGAEFAWPSDHGTN